jgi:ketosteroid isomerase-like protein
MSRENVERVREAFEHFAKTGEPLLEAIDPAMEIYDHDIPDAGTYRGREGFVSWMADWGEAWGEYGVEPEQWLDAGDKVVFIFQLTAKGRGSGVEVKRQDAMVWTIRDGIAVRIDYYNSAPRALEAAGLSEKDIHADPS